MYETLGKILTYLKVRQLAPFRIDVKHDSIYCTRQCQSSNQQHEQDDERKRCRKVDDFPDAFHAVHYAHVHDHPGYHVAYEQRPDDASRILNTVGNLEYVVTENGKFGKKNCFQAVLLMNVLEELIGRSFHSFNRGVHC